MNRKWLVGVGLFGLSCAALSIPACSSSSSGGGDDGGGDSGQDATASGSSSGTSSSSSGSTSSSGSSSGTTSSSSGGGDGGHDAGDAGPDADASQGDGTCPAAWSVAPTVPASITPDSGSGTVVLHALGSGTQNYSCIGTPIDGGVDAGDAGATFAWTLVTPEATLTDCNGATIGHHFASEAGAAAPEWLEVDNSYVIGRKLAAYTPDGGSGSIAWLLIQATGHGGTDAGLLSNVTYVQRLDTDGGVAPATGCDFSTADASTNVPYVADYYFFGP